MNDLALLTEKGGGTPRTVQLSFDDHTLFLIGANGFADAVPFWRLVRRASGSVQHIRRLDRPGWELKLTSGAHQELFGRIGTWPVAGTLIARLGGLKIAVGGLVIAFTIAEAIPATWLAAWVPEWAQERMVEGFIDGSAHQRCKREGGEEAGRKIVARLDPARARDVELVIVNDGPMMVSALPPNRLVITRGALADVDIEALAAMLAHNLAHLNHGDAKIAMVRYEGALGTIAAIIAGPDRHAAPARFSGQEEDRADRDAIAMMRRARVSMKPAAQMFEDMRTDQFFGQAYRNFHFGVAGRDRAWRAAAAAEPAQLAPLLTREESDSLFNVCWPGRIKSYDRGFVLPIPAQPAGQFELRSSDKQP